MRRATQHSHVAVGEVVGAIVGHGEGDCDSHAGGTGVDDCEAGLVCTKDSAANFGIKQVVPGNVADMCVDPKLGVPDGKGGIIGTNPDGSMKNSDLYGGGTALPPLDTPEKLQRKRELPVRRFSRDTVVWIDRRCIGHWHS